MGNYLVSAEEEYNDLVIAIEEIFHDIYPQYKHYPDIYTMLIWIAEASEYRKKYNDLLDSSLKHSQDMTKGMMEFFLNPAVHIDIKENDNETQYDDLSK